VFYLVSSPAPVVLGASFLLEHFYASAILNEPLVFWRLRSFWNIFTICNFG
jgi:hypothetical protein